MTAITRPWQWLGGQFVLDNRADQDHDAILLAQDPPAALVGRVSTAQSLANATFTDINQDTEFADNDGMYSGLSSVTIAHDGYYFVASGVTFATSATGVRVNGISLNAAVINEIADERPGLAGNPRFTVAGGLVLVTSDVIRTNVFQSSGGALNCNNRLTVVRITGPGS
jgi:hypothetical protein